jgi:transposase InsO family protein
MATHLGVNHKRTERVMRVNHIAPPRRKANSYYTTRSTSDHSYTNLIKEIDKSSIPPHHIWVSDLSYVKYDNTFYYLSTIEDLATRRIIATQVGKHHDASLVISTIRQAITASGGVLPTFFHTDQGKEFMASGTTEYLELQGVKVSVSDKGSPWQNGYKESFFGRFKDEFGDFDRFDTPGQLIEEIYSQIYYYNHKRIHTSLNMPPVTYTQKLLRSVYQERGT